MGVKDLWCILSPLCETKPLYELQGKTIAIDLSGWVVDSQLIVDNAIQPKMYLRNLYFRTSTLLMQGIFPVFVLDGEAPTLKHKTIARRNDIRNGFQEKKTARKVGRTQFNRILNECKQLLRYMGITCIQSNGEAEALCAYLNEDGLVDGCISQDSDCFLYGAKVVYRNFCTSTNGNRGGSVDVYSLDRIEESLNIGRNKMIALALLCGCDYDEGVSGVGKEAALKFFKTVEDDNVLQRIHEWRTDRRLVRAEWDLPNLCTSCGHPGKLQRHTKSGCTDCGTLTKCNNDFRDKRILLLNEISLRKKATQKENFPNQELLEEFLVRKDSVPTKLDIEWKQPQINQFIDFMDKHLCWEPKYAFEKIFTLSTRWQLLHLPNLTLDERLLVPNLFIPDKILKIRNIRSIASYEIIWNNEHSAIKLLKEYQEQARENVDNVNDIVLTSIEPQDLVQKCYPELVKIFEDTRTVKPKKRTANSRKKQPLREVTNLKENNTEVQQTAKAQSKKPQKKTVKESKNNRKVDDFASDEPLASLERSFEEIAIAPKRSRRQNTLNKLNEVRLNDVHESFTVRNSRQMKRGPQFERVLETERVTSSRLNNTIDRMFNDLSPDDFISENEDNDPDMTNVIEDICSKQIFQLTVENCHCTQSTDRSVENNLEKCTKLDKSLTLVTKDILVIDIEDENKQADKSTDEFGNISESYIPINQRLEIRQEKNKRTCNQTRKKLSFNFENIMNETDSDSTIVLSDTDTYQ
ncbi:flap endonuclease GEN [Pseudomyrmex gracilis]|uniref:flap endonuclease GEN n=1 Tax=Pseudomyrmex gracilis TaxID=219809 RepID=UPI000995C375|nr:flap endonuclease GEN [Pseudomyrmex gracilis]